MKKVAAVLKYTWLRFEKSEIPTRAAALAYHTILGIVPIVGLIFWYLDRIHLTQRWLTKLKDFIAAQLNVTSNAMFLHYFDRLTRSVRGASWGWIGLVILLYTAWNLVFKFGESLDVILCTATIQPEKQASFGWRVLRRLLVMLLLPLALSISLVLTDWIRQDSWFRIVFKLKTVGPVFALPFAWLATIIAVFFVYLLIPRNHVPWKEAARAALIVGPASEGIRFLFGIYNHHAVSTYKIYGVLAVIPLFILWVQIAWMLLLSGALLVRFSRPVGSLEDSSHS